MSRRKVVGLIIALLIFVIGACGCMKQDEQLYKEGLLTYLSEKYNTEFVIKEAYQEFNGNDGIYFRIICTSQDYDDEFLVYCYLDDAHEGDTIEIENKFCTISDEYAEVLLKHKVLDVIRGVATSEMFIECDVIFSGRQPMRDEMEEGLESCAANLDLQTYVKVYLISRDEISEEVVQATETLMAQLNPYTGYIYSVVEPYREAEGLKTLYDAESNFGNYLSGSQYDGHVEFILYKQETGLQEREIVKE